MKVKKEDCIRDFLKDYSFFFKGGLMSDYYFEVSDYFEGLEKGGVLNYHSMLAPYAYDIELLKRVEEKRMFTRIAPQTSVGIYATALHQIAPDFHLLTNLCVTVVKEEEGVQMVCLLYPYFKDIDKLNEFFESMDDLKISLENERNMGFSAGQQF